MKLKKNRNSLGAGVAELGPAMFVFFLFILFPLINLIAMGTGAATVYLISKQCASKAAASATFPQALVASQDAANNLITGGFGKFANLTPIGGYNGSGVDIYITETNIATNVSTKNGPNTSLVSNPVDTNQYLYSYDAVVTCDVGPFMNMNGVPFIGSVPGIGVPARLTYTASENVEHPEDLTVGASGGGGPGTGPGDSDGPPGTVAPGGPGGGGPIGGGEIPTDGTVPPTGGPTM